MDFKSLAYVSMLSTFVSLNAWTQSTDIQRLLMPKGVPPHQLAEKNNLIRLWPLSSVSSSNGKLDIQDTVSGRQVARGGSNLFTTSENVTAVKCGIRNFAQFKQGSITVDETELMGNIIKDSRQGIGESMILEINRKKVFAELKAPEKLGIKMPHNIEPYDFRHTNRVVKMISDIQNQAAIGQSTSMAQVIKNQQGKWQIDNPDFTIGGWFKPEYPQKKQMTLFRKYFENADARVRVPEWELFLDGDTIRLENNKDYEAPTREKFLTETEAKRFRGVNAHFYGKDDFYEDIVLKQKLQAMNNQRPVAVKGAQPSMAGQPLLKILVDTPIAHLSTKPVKPPSGGDIPPVVPVFPSPNQPLPPVVINPMPGIPVPEGEVPRPPPPMNPFIFGYEVRATGKDHPIVVTMPLGGCYGCVKPGQHSEVWHYMAISVHNNDPLGAYFDIYIIRDPNESQFGNKATLASHFIHRRIEIPNENGMTSRIVQNPVTNGYFTEAKCPNGNACTTSKLEIGNSQVKDRNYTGYMRGVYFAKKALNEGSIVEMASEFSPMDDNFCTQAKL